MIESRRGTYALILTCRSAPLIPAGRLLPFRAQRGHYVYVGSAFGPGGLRARGARIPAPGFGASDCRCASHLSFFERRPVRTAFERMLRAAVRARRPLRSAVIGR